MPRAPVVLQRERRWPRTRLIPLRQPRRRHLGPLGARARGRWRAGAVGGQRLCWRGGGVISCAPAWVASIGGWHVTWTKAARRAAAAGFAGARRYPTGPAVRCCRPACTRAARGGGTTNTTHRASSCLNFELLHVRGVAGMILQSNCRAKDFSVVGPSFSALSRGLGRKHPGQRPLQYLACSRPLAAGAGSERRCTGTYFRPTTAANFV